MIVFSLELLRTVQRRFSFQIKSPLTVRTALQGGYKVSLAAGCHAEDKLRLGPSGFAAPAFTGCAFICTCTRSRESCTDFQLRLLFKTICEGRIPNFAARTDKKSRVSAVWSFLSKVYPIAGSFVNRFSCKRRKLPQRAGGDE